ncbi:MAG TPA: polysaccharide deacetylase family protein, partial [Hyphomicrobium sp.]|nr:polysaccharide deacetylase family protein [Hyphomicrobium sp.]
MASPSRAGDSALQAACFAKDALAGREGERTPVRGNHKFDRDPLTRATLAAFTPVAAPLRGAIRRVDLPKGEKLIALTFDLCEQYGEVSGYDGGIFDYLRAESVAATLFAGGKWMRSHPERTQQLMTDPLFEMANHSEAHRNLRLLDATAMQNEILGPQRAYEAQRSQLLEMQCTRAHEAALSSVPTRLAMFRFPYGACNAASLNAVNDAGLLAIQWDLSSGDPDPRISVAALADGMLKRVKSGSIIVMHA